MSFYFRQFSFIFVLHKTEEYENTKQSYLTQK